MRSRISVSQSKLVLSALAVLILSLPFERILFHAGPFSVSSIELCAFLFLASVWIANCFDRQILRERVWASAVCFILALFLSAFLQKTYRVNALKFSLRMLAGIFLAWSIASLVRRDGRWRENLLALFAVTGGLAALLGLLEWRLSPDATAWSWLFRGPPHWIGGLKRLTGTFEYPNTAASFFLFSLAASISLGLSGKKFFRIVSFILVLALVLTCSRGALIAGATSLLLVAFSRRDTEKRREMIAWACLLGAMYGLALWFMPRLTHRLTSENDTRWLGARYEVLSFPPSLAPDRIYRIPMRLQNEGTAAWDDSLPFRLSYHWYDAGTLQVVVRDGLRTRFQSTIPPGGSVTVNALVKTPARSGDFILAFDMVQERFAWFSERGVAPDLIRCKIGPATESPPVRDLGETLSGVMDRSFTVTTRFDLWQAAWRLFLQHKWIGVGPDNYRFHYERALGRPTRFTAMYANNLFLEILADTGLLGFGALAVFLYLLLRRLRDSELSAQIALYAFFVHGMVDYFLEFSAIYIPFWIYIGMMAGRDVHPSIPPSLHSSIPVSVVKIPGDNFR
ncbi:MAG TPA: O-antigen ligase family protein [Acidobacteriota bacterium]|jgi:hypothetical protein